MSSSLIIEGKEYLPATIVGKQFDYSKDYILLLIKQGKIEGRKIANKWYAYEPSAKKFFDEAKKTKIERSAKIREERKLELKQHVQKVVEENEVSVSVPTYASRRLAVAETFAVILVGFMIGATAYIGSSSPSVPSVTQAQYSSLEKFALSLYTFFTPQESLTAEVISHTAPQNQSVDTSETQVISTTNTPPQGEHNSMIVLRENASTTEQLQAIRDSFSDPVHVSIDPEQKDTGVIIPKFRDTDGEAYRFLMVPVHKESDS